MRHGLLATVFEATGEVMPVVSDAFGHTVGWLDTQATAATGDDVWEWQQVQLTGYGPHKGFAAPVLAHATRYNLADHMGTASDMG